MKRNTLIALACLTILASPSVHADNLLQVYQQAAKHNATYLAAKETYQAAKEGVPIARGALLPQVNILSNGTSFKRDLKTDTNTYAFRLNATQNLFNYLNWKTYTQAQYQLKFDALTYQTAQQTLISSVATDYFNVLQARDNLAYATANERQTKEFYDQAEQQFKVGLKAVTDVQSARASYESAVASRISDENTLHDDFQTLSALTGRAETSLNLLKKNFPKVRPYPADPAVWSQISTQHNLAVLSDLEQTQIDKAGIQVSKAGYYPTADLTGNYTYSRSLGANTHDTTAGVTASWNLFNGWTTTNTVKQSKETLMADQATYEQEKRNAVSNTHSDYLTVLSDISQIKAYNQAVISGQASVKAAKAQYQVGTTTIYNLLQQQTALFLSQQQYASAIYTYINDSLQLKTDAGLLNPKDIVGINKWLDPNMTTLSQKKQVQTTPKKKS